jgi:ABC-type phosphate transport system permease subunit
VFWHVTLPNIRWGLLYGVILTNARAMGEFGAVSVISGEGGLLLPVGLLSPAAALFIGSSGLQQRFVSDQRLRLHVRPAWAWIDYNMLTGGDQGSSCVAWA